MSRIKDIALELAMTTAIADAAKDHKDYLRDELLEAMKEIGADATSADLNGEKIAKITTVNPSAKPYIVAEHELVWYVDANFKDQTYTKVREAFWSTWSKTLVPTEDGQAVNPETGEIVAGVRFKQATPYVSTRFDKNGREAIIDGIRKGMLIVDLTERKQLTEGTTE